MTGLTQVRQSLTWVRLPGRLLGVAQQEKSETENQPGRSRAGNPGDGGARQAGRGPEEAGRAGRAGVCSPTKEAWLSAACPGLRHANVQPDPAPLLGTRQRAAQPPKQVPPSPSRARPGPRDTGAPGGASARVARSRGGPPSGRPAPRIARAASHGGERTSSLRSFATCNCPPGAPDPGTASPGSRKARKTRTRVSRPGPHSSTLLRWGAPARGPDAGGAPREAARPAPRPRASPARLARALAGAGGQRAPGTRVGSARRPGALRPGGVGPRGSGGDRRAAHPRRISPPAWWAPSASWRRAGPAPRAAGTAAAAGRAGNSAPRPPFSIPFEPRQDGEEKVCGGGGVMWDGAGGASRAGWERPGARARGGTAAGCAPPARAPRQPGPGTPRPPPTRNRGLGSATARPRPAPHMRGPRTPPEEQPSRGVAFPFSGEFA